MDKNLYYVYVRDKKCWTVSDEKGNHASGITREMAYNQYRLLYENNIIKPEFKLPDNFNPFTQ